MRLFLLCLFLGAVSAEAPFAGYPASGWRPQGVEFRLPTEYGAPVVQQKVDVEISKENIALAAQVVEAATEDSLSNEYLPPTTTDQPELDPIRVQGLPEEQLRDFQGANLQQRQRFRQQQPITPVSGQLRAAPNKNFQFGRQEQAPPTQTYGVPDEDNSYNQQGNQYQGFQTTPRTNSATEGQQQQQQQPLFFLQSGQIRALPAAKNVQFSRQEQPQPAHTYGAPDDNKSDDQDLPENQYQGFQQTTKLNPSSQQPLNGQLRAMPANNFQFSRQEQAQPTQSYGVPDEDKNDSGNQDFPEEPNPTNTPDSNDDGEDNQNEQDPATGRPVIAIANSFSGQYYVLGQDSTLQRVMYATSQTDEDRRNMGFSAQLRYSQVEPIRGPVYAYNEQGQLIRIYK